VGREETFGSGGALEFVEERPVFGRVGVGKVSDGKPIHLLALQSIFLIVIYDFNTNSNKESLPSLQSLLSEKETIKTISVEEQVVPV